MPWFLNKQSKAIMNMPLVLNMSGFLNIKLYSGSEYVRALNIPGFGSLPGFGI